ncbi:5-formyltetrahydrofolate cyclo-ligase [Thauera sp. Sel9]|uniref:5-formyltetrahydrofolate cyclo-ligase n=1 Tax=Thauera sp. Sel9 TaxID=2974299 RepID=UPI0021E1265A|nr:5-formyltetrahydrofolate cyclo-ligase [Thauera sp. Sel9]MCV2217228.1 5-formyltetrahydrofolate cyclo-ligase [Thauera sp. Sel9]
MTKPVSDPADDIEKRRRFLRQQAIQAREALDEAKRAWLTARLAGHLGGVIDELAPRTLGFCWPFRAEPDLRDWVRDWLAGDAQRVAALPVVVAAGAAMHFRRWTPGAGMVLDRHGIPHPATPEEVAPEVVIVPLNAFDAAGYRLGYGGGYFDRTLAGMDVVAIGAGFELGRVPSVLPQPHDRPMDWIVTEAGAAHAGAARAGAVPTGAARASR